MLCKVAQERNIEHIPALFLLSHLINLCFQYTQLQRPMDRDTISQLSQESSDSREPPVLIAAGEIRRRLSESLHDSQRSTFTRDAEDPSAHVLKVC